MCGAVIAVIRIGFCIYFAVMRWASILLTVNSFIPTGKIIAEFIAVPRNYFYA